MKRRAKIGDKTGDKAGGGQRRKAANPERNTAPAAASRSSTSDADLRTQLDRRTRELAEVLEQQTATGEVLGIIASSPGDVRAVFEAMLAKAVRICGAKFGLLFLYEENTFRMVAMHGVPQSLAELRRREPLLDPAPGTALGRVVATLQPVQVDDVQTDPAYTGNATRRAGIIGAAGARTLIAVPMLKDAKLVGTISIYRQEVQPFGDREIALLTNFAAQAVIAIENARLLNELRASLAQQTATSDVLKVISSSPGELEPVFDAMLDNAIRICDAKLGGLSIFDGRNLHMAALKGAPPEFDELRRRERAIPLETTPM